MTMFPTDAQRAVYATQPAPLQNQIQKFLQEAPSHSIPGEIMALIVPDSNLLQGAPVAAEAYKLIEGTTFDHVIIISPSHTGSFGRLSICKVDRYRTPLGEVVVSDLVRNELCDEDDDIFLDDTGHYNTEGVDVQLPYLQTVLPDFHFVPIVMGEETPMFCRELGTAVGEVMYGHRTLLVASADLVTASEEGLEKLTALVEAMDVSRLMHLLNSEEVIMEGKGAVLVAMIASLRRGNPVTRVLRTVRPEGDAPGYLGAVIWNE